MLVAGALILKVPWPQACWEKIAGWGALLLAGPAVLIAGAGGSVASLTETLIFALVPALTVFLVSQREQEVMQGLLPALAGVGGLALMVPYSWPSTWFGGVWLGVLIVCSGALAFSGIKLHESLSKSADGSLSTVPLLWAGGLATGAAALVAGAGWAAFDRGAVAWTARNMGVEAGWGLLLDGPLALLLFWLIRELPPIALSARFTAVPLTTILGGLIMLRPSVGWTTWLGLALVGGSAWLLIRNTAHDAPSQSLSG